MAFTAFGSLNPTQKVAWVRKTILAARDKSWLKKLLGEDANSIIYRVTEITKQEKGDGAWVPLVADLVGDGVAGDDTREGAEEMLVASWIKIQIDQLAHQVRNKGKMDDQKTVIKFRTEGSDKLAFWLANRMDQMAILALSGVSFAFNNNGSVRAETTLSRLLFAADVTAPTALRHRRWNGTSLVVGDTTAMAAGNIITYKALTELTAHLKTTYMRGIMADGKEYYVIVLHPRVFATLRNDPDYKAAVINAMPRSAENPFFTGAAVTVDGLVIHDHNLVFNTLGAASGSKWGSGGTVDGARNLVLGAQALGMADLGEGSFTEKKFNYDTVMGMSLDRMFGLRKMVYPNVYTGTTEDFGVCCFDTTFV